MKNRQTYLLFVIGLVIGIGVTDFALAAIKNTEDEMARQLLEFSKQKRQIAARLKVDPYSSNDALQEELIRVA